MKAAISPATAVIAIVIVVAIVAAIGFFVLKGGDGDATSDMEPPADAANPDMGSEDPMDPAAPGPEGSAP